MIDLEKMAKEHEKLFQNATLESQVWKLEEEIQEFEEACKGEEINELADIVIVLGGLCRWCPRVAYHFYDGLTCMDYNWSLVEEEVNRKWQINLKRKWEWNGKTYHHIGEDE